MTDIQAKLKPSQIIYHRIHDMLSDSGVQTYLEDPPGDVTGTGEIYVVVRDAADGWEKDSYHASARHSVVAVCIYSDNTYLPVEDATLKDAHGKALTLFDMINRVLDYAPSDPNLMSCRLEQEPSVLPVNDDENISNSAVVLTARYLLCL